MTDLFCFRASVLLSSLQTRELCLVQKFERSCLVLLSSQTFLVPSAGYPQEPPCEHAAKHQTSITLQNLLSSWKMQVKICRRMEQTWTFALSAATKVQKFHGSVTVLKTLLP
ncbi:unnamed protein product [Musa textilis]